MPDTFNMSDVFISYAREDKPFAQRLHTALRAQGRECWVDWEDIPLSANWLSEVQAGIESAETFLFVISPDSLRSGPCGQEIAHAVQHNKRIVPVLRREVSPDDMHIMHPALSAHNWVFFNNDNDFDRAVANLNVALDTDLEHVRMHTRLIVRSREWTEKGGNPSLLLNGDDLRAAEDWLKNSVQKQPHPTDIQRQYITASRAAANNAARIRLATTVAVVVFATLMVLALLGFSAADQQRQVADEQRLIADSNRQAAEEARLIAESQRDQAVQNAQEASSLSLASSSLVALDDQNTDLALALGLLATGQSYKPRPETERALAESAYAPGTRRLLGGGRLVASTAVAISPDGRAALAGDGYGTLTLWNLDDGSVIRQFVGHSAGVNEVAFSADGTRALSGADDSLLIVWDIASGTARQQIQTPSAVLGLALSPDGRTALSGGSNGLLILWDLDTGAEIRRFTAEGLAVNSVALSPDGRFALSAAEDSITLWDVAGGFAVRTFSGHTAAVNSVVFSPDGLLVLSASSDFSLRLWDVETGIQVRRFGRGSLGHTDWVSAAVFTPDGRRIVSGAHDNNVILWDMETGTILRTFQGHTAQVTAVAVSPDGKRAITTSADRTLRYWDLENGAEARRAPLTPVDTDFSSLTFADQGRLLMALEGDGAVSVWDAQTAERIRRIVITDETGAPLPVAGFVLSPDEQTAASVTLNRMSIVIWRVDSGALVRRLGLDPDGRLRYSGSALAFSPDGQYLLGAARNGILQLWTVATGEVRTFGGHRGLVLSLAFSADGQWALSTANTPDSTIRLWEVASGRFVRRFTGHSDAVQSAVFSPDGAFILSSSRDNTLRMWRLDNGREVKRFSGHSGAVIGGLFRADGQLILSGSTDGTARVWDVNLGVEVRRFEGHTDVLQAVTISPDGTLAASVAYDGTLRLWHVHDLNRLIEWARNNRYVRDLSCDERRVFNVQPLCDQSIATALLDAVNVRSGPDTTYDTISQVKTGDTFPIIGDTITGEDTWYQVQLPGGQQGWIRADLVSVGAPPLAAPANP